MITTTHDPQADALRTSLLPEGAEVADAVEVAPGVVRDLDAEGRPIGIEVLGVAWRALVPPPASTPAA